MLVLHHLENSRSQRIAWLLDELDIDYELQVYKRDPETILAPPELKSVHPLGKAPVITDGDITVAESGAIIEYLLDREDDHRLRPAAGTQARRDFTFWLHYAEGSFMPLMVLSIVMRRIEDAPLPFFIRPVAKAIVQKVREGYLDANVARHLNFIEDALTDNAWFAGEEFSAADIQMSYCLEAASARVAIEVYPNIHRFMTAISNRPAYRSAEKKLGSFALPG